MVKLHCGAESRMRNRLAVSSLLLILLLPRWTQAQTTKSAVKFQRERTGLLVVTPTDDLHIAVCDDSTLHVTAQKRGTPSTAEPPVTAKPWILEECDSDNFSIVIDEKKAVLSTASVQASVLAGDGLLTFADASGKPLLAEVDGRSYEPNGGNDASIQRVTDRFFPEENEGIYGLGQHQSGVFNYRGSSVYLSQMNTDVAIPFFLSTRGYGLLWNTASTSLFDNRYPNQLNLVATAATGVDYYFMYGPEADRVVHEYRRLTGKAPLFPKWAYGFFQSRDRYASQDELLKIVHDYRTAHIPVDVVVQDWFWWQKQGDSSFNREYPDMRKALDQLHNQDHAHMIISIWPIFDPNSSMAQEMTKRKFLISGTYDYDATNPEARELYWKSLAGPLFSLGMDGFWLDDSEPEQPRGNQSIQPGSKLFLGPSALYSNVFPYEHTLGVYQNWRQTDNTKRVFILTRSAFAGNQHNSAVTWSGDVYSTFWALSRQIPAGLNFALSGLPYWTTDIGGYGYPSFKSSDDPLFQELYTRWFEFGVFCPIFRTHGHRANSKNELTAFGLATPTLVQYDRLRYRMLPYIYSLAWKVTNDDYTIMRPLVMDWRGDQRVRDLGDEFMFGPAILVSPVTEAGATSRSVYLPHAGRWYDFWTGDTVADGMRLASAPLDRIPLYIKAGSILPLGPEVEYAEQKPDDPIELRVYAGADGEFDLYEDAGDSYDYERGAHAIIPIHWNDSAKTLTIGAVEGDYPGMAASRHFSVVLVSREHGAGQEVTIRADRQVDYTGIAINVDLKSAE